MSFSGWLDIWHSTVALVGRAPIFTQVMVWLGVAFAIVMCLEGLRVSFLPRRWLATRMTRMLFMTPPKLAAGSAAGFSLKSELRDKPQRGVAKASRPKKPARNRKKVISAVRRTQPIKPKIRRYPADPAPLAVEADRSELTFVPMH